MLREDGTRNELPRSAERGTSRESSVSVIGSPAVPNQTRTHSRAKAQYRSRLNQSVKEIDLPAEFQDLISALYWFRNQPLASEAVLTVNLYTDEKIYQTELHLQPPMLLELLKRGTFRCLVVEPRTAFKGLLVKRGRIWAYLTADAHRLPLLVKATTPWGAMSVVLDESSIPPSLLSSQ